MTNFLDFFFKTAPLAYQDSIHVEKVCEVIRVTFEWRKNVNISNYKISVKILFL